MSISSALNNLNNDIEAAKSAITAKGGTAPSGTAGLASSIGSIPSGIEDVTVNGNSVVTDGAAEIDLSDYAEKTDLDELQTKTITDTGGYFTTDTVEGALAEIGAELAGINTLIGSGVIT